MKKNLLQLIIFVQVLIFVLLPVSTIQAQEDIIDFNSDRWVLVNGEVVDYLGRKSLAGSAYLPGVEFENGVIEFDLAVTGQSGYPGVNFRVQSPENYEYFLYPAAAGRAPIASVTPLFWGLSGSTMPPTCR